MRKTRVFINSALQTGEVVALTGEAAHHLGRVLKARVGDTVIAFNGRGGSYESAIAGIDRRSITIKPLHFHAENNESPLKVTLAQGISRGQHMDYTVQKAVELGVSRIVPLFTEFSNVRLEEERAQKRHDHWHKIITGACEQSGRNLLPELATAMQLADWVGDDSATLRLLMHADTTEGPGNLPPGIKDVTLLCGPEGGLSRAEIDRALACGYRMVALGPRILRTETAAIAAITACQMLWGDMMYNRRSQD